MNLNKPRPLTTGDRVHGFCEGIFGRDSYDCKTVEARGVDWAVFRTDHGYITLAVSDDLDRLAYLRDNPSAGTADHGVRCPQTGDAS
jgi:hypothetical protein